MNILVDKLPTEYEGLKVDTNFRSFILFELLMQDRQLSKKEKIMLSLNLFYDEIPQDIKKGIDGIVWFYTRGKEIKQNKNDSIRKESQKKIYSFEYDADLIYTAFLDQYGVDLNDIEYLHWFKFKAMFEGLKNDNKICEVMGYRAIDINKIKNKDEKNKYKKLQREWALPDDRTEEEKERDFAEAFW